MSPDFAHSFTRVGRWWYQEQEVDVAGVNEDDETLLLGECKWTDEPIGPDLLADLESVEPDVRWRGTDRSVVYALFAKAGFTDALHATADGRDDVLLFDASDVVALS